MALPGHYGGVREALFGKAFLECVCFRMHSFRAVSCNLFCRAGAWVRKSLLAACPTRKMGIYAQPRAILDFYETGLSLHLAPSP